MASAGSEARRRAFEDLLHCMICFEAYRTPKMLHCAHTFCADCLSGYYRTYQQQKRAIPGKIPCPTCRELTSLPLNGIAGLKNDFKVKKMEEMFRTVSIKFRSSSMVCDPCKAQKKSTACHAYCPNCSMNYCTACLKKHDKNPVFKGHKVVDKGTSQQGSSSDFVCRVHSDEKGRYFCKTCEMLVCTICIVQGHEGHNVTEIDDLFKQHHLEIKNLRNVVDSRLSRLKKKSAELEVLRQANLSACQQAEIEIKERTKQSIEALRTQEAKLLEDLRKKRDEKLKQISKEVDRVSFHINKSYNMSEYASTTVQRNSLRMIAVHEEFIQRMRTVADTDATTLADSDICTVIRFLPARQEPSIGRIDEEREDPAELSRNSAVQPNIPQNRPSLQPALDQDRNRASRPKLIMHINRCGSKQGEIRDPLGVACLLNGDLVVTEWGNKRVQLFDSVGKSIDIIGSRQLQAPQGVAITLKGNIIVTDGQQKRLQVFSPSGSGLARWGLGKFFTPCGICISPNGNCIVSDAGEHSISIFQGERTCLKRFGSQGNGEYQFKNPLYITTGQHNEIVVSDSDNHCIKVYNSSGRYMHTFGGHGNGDGQLHFPRGVCCDQEGNIVVADRNNHRVCLFSSNGRFLRHLLTKDDGIKDPYAVDISMAANLVVTESSSNKASVKMFQL